MLAPRLLVFTVRHRHHARQALAASDFSRPRQLWRRRPSSCACLPTMGTTALVVSRPTGTQKGCAFQVSGCRWISCLISLVQQYFPRVSYGFYWGVNGVPSAVKEHKNFDSHLPLPSGSHVFRVCLAPGVQDYETFLEICVREFVVWFPRKSCSIIGTTTSWFSGICRPELGRSL